MELWKPTPKMPSSHNKPDGTPCDGILVWGKNTSKLRANSLIRRECPVCGFRQQYNPSMAQWLDHARNSEPGTGRWVNGS